MGAIALRGSWNEWSRDPSLPIEEGLPYPVSRLAA
jgi:thiosulfate/3-mercaptopyruvate sulfurtransferase